MFDVVTIGSATRDMFVEGDFPIIPWKGTPSGKAYAFPRGEKLSISKMFFTLGGNAANAAVTFARQGLKAACVSKVGNDAGGHEAVRRLRADGVETKFISCDKERPTSYSVLILEDGERTILNYQGASNAFELKDIPFGKINARWWYLSSPGKSAAAFPALMRHATRKGIRVGFNPTGYHLAHYRKDILRALPAISFLVINDEEAAQLTGLPFGEHERIMRWVSGRMPDGIFAMTLGSKGAMIAYRGNLYRAGIFKERKIEDRTGAGDSWGAGFVAGLIAKSKIKNQNEKSREKLGMVNFSQDDICYAIRLASANATANVEIIGATEGTLTRREFERESRWKKFPVSITEL